MANVDTLKATRPSLRSFHCSERRTASALGKLGNAGTVATVWTGRQRLALRSLSPASAFLRRLSACPYTADCYISEKHILGLVMELSA